MKKRGFTLIELLAVIVVLAIIALIATPIVMNVIKDAQKGAAERSAERYVNAVETALAADRLENDMIKDGIYTVDVSGNLVLDDKTLTVEVSGDKPASGSKVVIKNGQVVLEKTRITVGDYTLTIDDKGSAVVLNILCKATDVSVQKIWDSQTSQLILEEVGIRVTDETEYMAGATYSCDLGDGERTFYVLKEDGNNVKLIMNENMGGSVAWCAQGGPYHNNNACAADGAKAYLASQTSEWTKLSPEQITLPSRDDMAPVAGQAWMRTNLDRNKIEFKYGYWTSSLNAADSGRAIYVLYDGSFNGWGTVYDVSTNGVRPVITISKSNMSL